LRRRSYIILGATLLLILASCGLSSDAALERSFYAHQAELEMVREMFSLDQSFDDITTSFVRPTRASEIGRMPEDRLRRYRSYFAAIGISGVARRDDAVILFMVDTTGMLSKGKYKGYAYLPTKAAKTYAQLDRASDGTTWTVIRTTSF
jgi:hypothetical protein